MNGVRAHSGRGSFPEVSDLPPDVEIRLGEPLARHTTFRIGGPVACLLRPGTETALTETLKLLRERGIAPVILGGGSNVLAPDEPWDAVVVQLRETRSAIIAAVDDADETEWVVGAGVRLSALLGRCVEAGFGGLEPLAGIPGTVGGAVIMNAGTRDGCVADVLRWVDVVGRDGLRRRISREELPAGYRSMGIPDGAVVIGAGFRLRRMDGAELLGRMRESMTLRRKAQPLGIPSAGSIFKNPPGFSAGALVDRAGLKGLRMGGAEISSRHAGWIVNRGNARAEDVLGLMERMARDVFDRFGVRLDPEIRMFGPAGDDWAERFSRNLG